MKRAILATLLLGACTTVYRPPELEAAWKACAIRLAYERPVRLGPLAKRECVREEGWVLEHTENGVQWVDHLVLNEQFEAALAALDAK